MVFSICLQVLQDGSVVQVHTQQTLPDGTVVNVHTPTEQQQPQPVANATRPTFLDADGLMVYEPESIKVWKQSNANVVFICIQA
jgi:hypothetical protein